MSTGFYPRTAADATTVAPGTTGATGTTGAAADPDAIDLTDPALYAGGPPVGLWRRLRAAGPVRWHDADPIGFWSVTGFPEADQVLGDHTAFTSERGTLLYLLGIDDPAGGRQMAATDPPRHRQMRVPLQRALAAKALTRHHDAIRAEVRTLLAPAADGGEFDIATALAALPMAVTGNLMALPRADWPLLTRLTTMSIAPDDPEYAEPGGRDATLRAAHRRLFAYFHGVVAERAAAPGDDLVSTMLATRVDGAPQEVDGVLSNSYSLLLGANVTTPHAATAAIAVRDRPVLAELRARPQLLTTGMEEAVRWASPANHFMRYATRDVTIAGCDIAAGDPVVAWLGAANRDERAFADPDTFDIARKPNRHIAFGAGPHYCVGHVLAKVTLRILFEELITMCSSLEVVGEPSYLHSNFIAGIKHLPVVLRPA